MSESEACDSASVVPIHTRSEVSSDFDSAYDSASVTSVASVNQPLKRNCAEHSSSFAIFAKFASIANFYGPPHCFVLCLVGDCGNIVIFAIFAKFASIANFYFLV